MALELQPDTALIGLDGGASEVKAAAVALGRGGLALGGDVQGLRPETAAGFAPLPLARQELERARPVLGERERAQGAHWIEAAAQACARALRSAGARRARIGVCAVGLPGAGRRGTVLALHAPRMPDLLAALERRLEELQVELETPLPPLRGDGECCGLGEEHGAAGLFRGVESAYYAGGGTGLAEAVKLGGSVLALEAVPMQKAWQLEHRGQSFEEWLSAAGINRAFARRLGRAGDFAGFPERDPEHPVARATFEEAGAALGALAFERLRGAWRGEPRRLLARIVVGQRLGAFFLDARTGLAEAARRALAERIAAEQDAAMRSRAREVELCGSALREAPILGAAAWALGADA